LALRIPSLARGRHAALGTARGWAKAPEKLNGNGTSFFDGYGNLTPDVTHERIKQPRSAASCTPRAATAEQ